MKFHLATDIYFDGTNLSLDISEIVDAATGEVFLSHVDAGAKVIEFFRAKGMDVYDNRAAFQSNAPQLTAEPEAVEEPIEEPIAAVDPIIPAKGLL